MARFNIEVTVDDEDLAQFVGLDELDQSLDARLSEVYDDNGNPLTTMRVVKLERIG